LKTISLEAQPIPDTYLPSWGKSEAYSLLITYYLDRKNYDEAKKHIAVALSLYPDNYMINQYVEMLKDK
jgi:tetratricopeptide (TPR) repeat protein